MLMCLHLCSAELVTWVSEQGAACSTSSLLSAWLGRVLVIFSQGPVSQALNTGGGGLVCSISSVTPVASGQCFELELFPVHGCQ